MKLLVLAFGLSCALLVYAEDGCPDNEKEGKGELTCDGEITKGDKKGCYCKLPFLRNDQGKCVAFTDCGKGEETTTTEKTTTTTKPEPTQTPCPPPKETNKHCPAGSDLIRVQCRRHSGGTGYNPGYNTKYCYTCAPQKQPYPKH